jgi:hypothetical protein
MAKPVLTARQVALDLYLAAFDRFLTAETPENLSELDAARARWVLEIALDESQTRLAV